MANRFVCRQDEDGPSGERRGLTTVGLVVDIAFEDIDDDLLYVVRVEALLLACGRDRLGEPFAGCPGSLLGCGEEEARSHAGGVCLALIDSPSVASSV